MLEDLKQNIIKEINDAQSVDDLKQIKVATLGKKGSVTLITKNMKDKTPEERKIVGKEANELKEYVEIILEQKESFLAEKEIVQQIEEDAIDIFLPGTNLPKGTFHPLTMAQMELETFFRSLGYSVNEGNEIETDIYNFQKLNIPKDHPARDMSDTFYFDDEELLRTHTSPVQARSLEETGGNKPIRMICPGKTYRRDEDDATHSHQFHQCEGMVIDENISLSDLKGTLELFARYMFGENTEIRFRPSYFPFTEPGVEVDVTCHLCHGKGCNVCKKTGWIEILGAGQVHPYVIAEAGYDPERFQGFAFGMGIDRIAMLKYGVDDIRHFYENNVDLLDQFDKVK